MAVVLLAAAAAGLLAFQLVNSLRTRVKLGHWQVKALVPLLRSELLIGCVSPVTIVTLALLCEPSGWMLLAFTALFGFSQVIYEPVQRQIRAEVEKAGKEHGTKYFRSRTPLDRFGVTKSLDEMAEDEQAAGLWKVLISLGKDPWQKGLSRTRSLILYMLLFCAALAAAAAGDVFLHDTVLHDHGEKVEKESEDETNVGSAEGSSDGDMGGSSGGSGGETVAPEAEGHCRFEPGQGAPAWAKANLYALYYGGADLNATEPPGTKIGGCPGRVIVPPGLKGSFVYQIGKNPAGEVRSVAVDSVRFGPAIFLSPAAQRVIEMIHRGVMPLGGYPKVDTRGGDMVPVTTPAGTVVLVRAGKVLTGSVTYAAPYVQLPATVATAWVEAMRAEAAWLWPLEPLRRYGGTVYRFSPDSDGGASGRSVVFDPDTGITEAGASTHHPPDPQLSQAELEEFAHRAR